MTEEPARGVPLRTDVVHGLPPLPEGYETIIFGPTEAGPHVWLSSNGGWIEGNYPCKRHIIHAIPSAAPRPWYPLEWLDDNGDPLPDVYEHDGGWPKCGPNGLVEALLRWQRETRGCRSSANLADARIWRHDGGDVDIVAYRVISE